MMPLMMPLIFIPWLVHACRRPSSVILPSHSPGLAPALSCGSLAILMAMCNFALACCLCFLRVLLCPFLPLVPTPL